jgi:hypothetical protein
LSKKYVRLVYNYTNSTNGDSMNRSESGRLGGIKSGYFQKQKHEKYVENYLKNPKYCKTCGKQITYNKRRNDFCSSSCSARFNNIGISRNTGNGKNAEYLFYGKDVECIFCGQITKNKKYCSYKCHRAAKWQATKELMEKNNALLPTNCGYGYNPRIAKKYLAETRGYKCAICAYSEWRGEPIPLILDHINGNPEDHRLENVRLVCGNCNMQLPTFAGRNIGKGRKNRGWIYKAHLSPP